jgi:rRNA-processing protein FCF1
VFPFLCEKLTIAIDTNVFISYFSRNSDLVYPSTTTTINRDSACGGNSSTRSKQQFFKKSKMQSFHSSESFAESEDYDFSQFIFYYTLSTLPNQRLYKEIDIFIPFKVIEELDGLKKKSEISKITVNRILKWIEKAQNRKLLIPVSIEQKSVSVDFLFKFLQIQGDDYILDSISKLKDGRDICLLTFDTGMRLKANSMNIYAPSLDQSATIKNWFS